MDKGRCRLMPSASTVHGLTPMPLTTRQASPVPKSHRPNTRIANVPGPVRHREVARHRVIGIEREGCRNVNREDIVPIVVQCGHDAADIEHRGVRGGVRSGACRLFVRRQFVG